MSVLSIARPAVAEPLRAVAPRGFWKRLVNSMIEIRRQAVDRELAAFFDRHPHLPRPPGLPSRSAWKQASHALPF